MSVQPVNLMVFREGRRDVSACQVQSYLVDCLRHWTAGPRQDSTLALLLLAGELECGVADAVATGSPPPRVPVLIQLESITDALAESLVGRELETQMETLRLAETLETMQVPERISVSAPEGFAYYALHPLAYAEAVKGLTQLGDVFAIVGIRSIGTTLSAVAAATVRTQEKKASRITVRPHGHPYNRELRFSEAESEFVARARAESADFVIVDEGPGLSGSSFLAVAEALVRAGIPPQRITIICGHQPNFDSLRAHQAPQRARRFRWLPVDNAPRIPQGTGPFLGGGEWRRLLLSEEAAWPPVWTSFERLKYRSADTQSSECRSSGYQSSDGVRGSRFYKFLGLGHYGEAVLERERRVAEAGFGPEPTPEADGFASYHWINGRPMCSADLKNPGLNHQALDRLAKYCAFRASAFPVELHDLSPLQEMAAHNLAELGFCERRLLGPIQLELIRPVIVDGRMQPHEWLLTRDGQILKTDSGSHGDDHFFPGPSDIAWDLAGAIVEWEMSAEQSATFLELYGRESGDEASPRIEHFIIAYSVFRTAYCLMAANALGEGEERRRFHLAAERYKRAVQLPFLAASTAIA